MKGLILPFATTITVVLVAVALSIAAVFIYAGLVIAGTKIENKFDFATFVSTPYDASIAISENSLEKRNFIERSLATALTAKPESDFPDVRYYLNGYDFDVWFFSVYTDPKLSERLGREAVAYNIDNIPKKCGDTNQGYCVGIHVTAYYGKSDFCGVGRVKIDENDKCGFSEVCCQEDEAVYIAQPDHYDTIYRCGGSGYCTGELEYGIDILSWRSEDCGAGRFRFEDVENECESTNGGETPVCCVPIEYDALKEIGRVTSAEIPLIYKGKTLYEPKNYDCFDINSQACDGEYVRDLCAGPENIQCCIDDVVHCESPREDYVCMDVEHCNGEVLEGENNEKLCPGPQNYVCCSTNEPAIDENYNPANNAEPQGTCTLGGNAYTGEPFMGTAEITVSG